MSSKVTLPSTAVRLETLDEGAIWRVVLNTPRANILDGEKCALLTRVFESVRDDTNVKAVVLDGEGPNFSFGASVQEHLPDQCAAMFASFHGLFRAMLDASVATLAVVRGHCLGGGLELAAFCNRVHAREDARLGQPEITLGVFAPVASVILCERMGRGAGEDLLLSGRIITAREAHAAGLVDQLDDDPGEAALAYAREHLLPRSASSLRLAVHAARLDFGERFTAALARLEDLYLDDLMRTEDAVEGLNAFLEKRAPRWRNR